MNRDARLLRGVLAAALGAMGCCAASVILLFTYAGTGGVSGWLTAARVMIQGAYACGGVACAGAVIMLWARRRRRRE